MGNKSEEVTASFKGAVEQLIAAHVQETNELRKIIADTEAVYATKREKWSKDKIARTAEIEKLKKDKNELRGMLKKAQVLLDNYRSQLRRQLQDHMEDEKIDTLKDEKDDEVAKSKNTIILDDTSSTSTTTSNPPTPSTPSTTTSTPSTPSPTPTKKKKETSNNTEKTDKTRKTEKNDTPSTQDTKERDRKTTITPPKDLDKGGTLVQPIDLSLDEPLSSTETNNNTNNNNNANNNTNNNNNMKKNNYKASNLLDDNLDDFLNEISNPTTTNTTTTTPVQPTKTKYNKYNLTPIAKDHSLSSDKSKAPTNTPNNQTNTKPRKSKSANTSPTNADGDADSDFYQKIYDEFSKTGTKRLADDFDLDGPSSLDNAAMPPPAATTGKKFKYTEVVRNKEDRAALPAHECDQCRKFYEALGDGYDRSKMVNHCSRHRARDAIPDTPPDFWQMSFPSSETQDI